MILRLTRVDNPIIDKLIRWWTKSDWSHIDYVLPEATEEYFENKYLTAVSKKGVSFNSNEKKIFKYIYFKLTERQEADVRKFLFSKLSHDYDISGIIGFIKKGKNTLQNKNAYFCSELIIMAMQYAKIIDISGLSKFTPEDFNKLYLDTIIL